MNSRQLELPPQTRMLDKPLQETRHKLTTAELTPRARMLDKPLQETRHELTTAGTPTTN